MRIHANRCKVHYIHENLWTGKWEELVDDVIELNKGQNFPFAI